MKTKKPIIYVLSGVVGLLSISGVVLATHSSATTISDNYKSDMQSALKQTAPFEHVNGTPIQKRDFAIFEANAKYAALTNGQSVPSQAQMLKDFNVDQALYLLAKNQGFQVSQQEAKDYSNQFRNMMENPPANADLASLNIVKQSFKDEEAALGLTDDEFWNNYEPIGYQRDLTIGKLHQQFNNQYKESHPSADFNELSQAWTDYGNQQFSRSTVSPN